MSRSWGGASWRSGRQCRRGALFAPPLAQLSNGRGRTLGGGDETTCSKVHGEDVNRITGYCNPCDLVRAWMTIAKGINPREGSIWVMALFSERPELQIREDYLFIAGNGQRQLPRRLLRQAWMRPSIEEKFFTTTNPKSLIPCTTTGCHH